MLSNFAQLFSLWAALLAASNCSSRGQESPQRFLQATQWIAQITRSVIDNGAATVEDQEWEWDLSTLVKVQFRMTKLPQGENVPVWQAVETQNYTGSGHEKLTQIPLSGGSIIGNGQPASRQPAPIFGLTVDPTAQTYTLSFGTLSVPWDGTIDYSGLFSIPQPDITFWAGATSGNIERPLPATGMALEGQDTYSLGATPLVHTSLGVAPVYVRNLGSGNIQVTWNIRPQIEVVELAVEIDGYQDYLPEGNFDDATKAGNALDIKATIQGTNGAPTTAKATWIRFEVSDVSREPGVCLNQPIKMFAKTDPDYKFEQDLNPPPMIRQSATLVETIPGGLYSSATATLSSFDFGGWCNLKVTAEVDGQVLTGYLTTDKVRDSDQIRIPRRQRDSHIADKWLEDEGAVGMADDSDSEDQPPGDGHTGDGFSLYEEYRGFCQNGAILRTTAKKKDLMVLNTIGGPGAAACALFQKVSQLVIHSEFQVKEFSSDPFGTRDNWLNFNYGSHHVTDQHGLRFRLDSVDRGFALCENVENSNLNSTPGSKSEIIVPPTLTGLAAADETGTGRAAKYAAASYAHEIAHGCAVWHHGESDPGTVSWAATDGAEGLDWLENGGAVIFPRFESGAALVPKTVTNSLGQVSYKTATIVLGREHGQHSGDTKCLMRYDTATAYIPPENASVRYYTGGGEEVGAALCIDPAGTGVNAQDRPPRPRFGDAATGRGNCTAQICVNDKYVSDAKHNR